MKKVLVSDKLAQEGLDILEKTEGIACDYKTGMTPDELKAVIGGYDGIIIRSATKLKADILAEAKNLKIAVRAGVGIDNIDLAKATEMGIVVENTPGGTTNGVAELALGLMYSAARHIPAADASMKNGQWEKKAFAGTEVAGKVIGIIGLGRIGLRLADLARAVGAAKVIGFDPVTPKEKAAEHGVTMKSVEEIFAEADYVSLHVPKNESTANMVNAALLAKAKKGIIVVNVARGGVVNETDMAAALESGQVRCYAADVWSKEPLEDYSLAKNPKVIALPHLGASSAEGQVAVAVEGATNICDFLLKGEKRCAFN